ncbi:MAG: alkaline phosphatase [bacterium]
MKNIKLKQALIITAILIFIILFLFGIYYIFLKPSTTQISKDSSKNLIVLFSLDGLGSNLLGENTPYLNSVMNNSQSSYTLDMQTVNQSETMPSHMSMLTGLNQEHHGFTLNAVDINTLSLKFKTLFDYSLENGYSYDSFVTKDKLLYFQAGKTGSNVIFKDGLSSDVKLDIEKLVKANSSKLFVFIHLRDVDTIGHAKGWGSTDQLNALKILDGNLKEIVESINTKFSSYSREYIFTADHGGEGTTHSSGCANCRRIPLIIESENVKSKYVLNSSAYNIYDVACIVLNMMDSKEVLGLDCKR